MKQIILSFFLITGLFFSASAQQDAKYKVSLGGEFLNPMGSTAEVYSVGYGGSLKGEYKLSPKFNTTLSVGYTTVATSKLYKAIFTPWGGNVDNTVVYPAKAGLKYNLNKIFYAAADAGVAFSAEPTVRSHSFAYSGGVGTSFEISPKSSIDVGVRYEEWALSTKVRDSFAVLRAAYVFGF